MKRAVTAGVVIVLAIALAVLQLSTFSSFLISDTYVVEEEVDHRLTIDIDEVPDYYDEYTVRAKVLDDSGTILQDSEEEYIDDNVIGQTNTIEVGGQTEEIIDTNIFFEQLFDDYRSTLIPEDYNNGLRDFDISSEIQVEGNEETEREIEIFYEFKDFPQTDFEDDEPPMELSEYEFEILYNYYDGKEVIEIEYRSDYIDEQLLIDIEAKDGEVTEFTTQYDGEGTVTEPEEWDDQRVLDYIMEYGHLRQQDDGSFVTKDSLVDGQEIESLPANEDSTSIPDIGEDIGGLTNYELDLATLDVELEDVGETEVENVWLNGEDITDEVNSVEREGDIIRIEFSGNETIVYEDQIDVEFSTENPKVDGAYNSEIVGYGSGDDDLDTGIEVMTESDSFESNQIFTDENFLVKFGNDGIFEYEYTLYGDSEKITTENYEFKVYNPGNPPSAFEELNIFFEENFLSGFDFWFFSE